MERNLTHIALFAALIAVLGLVPKIDLVSGVPITAQSMGIMLCGTVLGARRGALAVLLFLALVALGLPLLSGGRGGIGVFMGPSMGYLVGFPIAAFVTGLIVEKWQGPIAVAAFAGAVIGGIIVLSGCGIVGFRVYSVLIAEGVPDAKTFTWAQAVAAASPFIIGDVIKAGLAAGITRGLARVRPASVLSRS